MVVDGEFLKSSLLLAPCFSVEKVVGTLKTNFRLSNFVLSPSLLPRLLSRHAYEKMRALQKPKTLSVLLKNA
jgi:hypothetical protein